MFPLESVVVPGMLLPLHVFEPRYRALVRDCLADAGELGVVLIERGSEVGGGDERSSVGTIARILRAEELDDGRWAVIAAGERRLRVARWLDDAPYPRAEVEEWPDEPAGPDDQAAFEAAAVLLRRLLAAKAELDEVAPPPTIELADDPVLGSYQILAVAPIGPFDRQALLSASGPTDRLALIERVLGEELEVLEARLGGALG